MQDLSKKIEAILFFKGEPVSKKELTKILGVDNIDVYIDELKNELKDTGLCIIEIDNEYSLRTSPLVSDMLKKLQEEELDRDLGKATLETLALIIYKGPIRRSEIDNIRGVNSSYILRTRMIRGLIDRSTDPKDSRTHIYKPSFDLLSHLGITDIKQLSNWEEVVQELNKFNEDFKETN